jgi:ABC-2 type transport system permease protein
MRKALIVGASELHTAVRSRAFLISLVAMPVLMLGSIVAQHLLAKRVDTTARRFAVIDRSGKIWDGLATAAERHNREVAATPDRPATGGAFTPERIEPGATLDETRLALSDRVRKRELFAFIEIPPDVLREDAGARGVVSYYSDDPSKTELLQWLRQAITDEARAQRLRAIGADPTTIARLTTPVGAMALGLWTRGDGGTIQPAKPVDKIRTFVVPMVLMFIVFIVVMTSTPMLLNSVLEEKMSRISEVLLGSVTPFELMLGKLLGAAGTALLLGTIYVAGGLGVARYLGYGEIVPLSLFPALLLFLVLAVFFFGSLYIAIGSACSELKDAQSLMMPVILLTVMPMMVWSAVLRDPNGGLSVGMSLFPPATPFLMLLRMALHPAPPMWQVGLSVLLTTLATIGCVWAAGRIFRIGVLAQGKPASFADMARWVFTK